MAKYPEAVLRLLPENSTEPPITPRVLILHSAVGSGSLYNYFLNSTNLESHFWVSKDGKVEQYIDTGRQADANHEANNFAISVESADNGNPDKDPWTDIQIQRFAELIVWANKTHGIPIKRCDKWNGSGIGYHTMWGAPSHWTPSVKTCPGKVRINQFDDVLALAKELAAPPPKPPPEDDNMPKLTDMVPVTGSAARFLEARGAVLQDLNGNSVPKGTDGYLPYEWFVVWGHIEVIKNTEATVRIENDVDAVNAVLNTNTPPTG